MKRKKPAPTLAKLKARAWKLLSECIRREAADQAGNVPCFTCGRVWGWNMGIQAGHAIPGRTGAVLLDEELIRPQDYHCNVGLRGNYPVFVTKLIREKAFSREAENLVGISPLVFAMDWWEAKLQSARQIKKWDRSELEAKCAEYRERIARL